MSGQLRAAFVSESKRPGRRNGSAPGEGVGVGLVGRAAGGLLVQVLCRAGDRRFELSGTSRAIRKRHTEPISYEER